PVFASSSQAIIVFQDPGRLTTMPVLAGGVKPGWQYLGQYGSFNGIPIGPRAWVTAFHVAAGTGTLFYDNAGASALTAYNSTYFGSSGDLAVMTLNSDQPSFTAWAPVWSDPNSLQANQPVYMYGRGTARGSVATNNTPTPGTAKGWEWGASDGVQSYGTNNLDALAIDGGSNIYLVMSFTQPTGTNNIPNTEGILSSGDSGSGDFAFNPVTNQWELVGINYAVDVPSLTPGGSPYYAALYDMSGYYDGTSLITSNAPANSYSTSVAHKYSFIAPFIPVPEPGTWVMGIIASLSIIYLVRRAA
ncbi:MAG: hypothetical protein ACKO85_19975, partial [Isosphaeraceae bacterium]